MAEFKKIEYYNLRAEAAKLPELIGRADEIERLDRVINRRINSNAMIVGPAGSGKTTLVRGWLKHLASQSEYDQLALVQLETDHLHSIQDATERYQEALATLPASVVCIDNFGHAILHGNGLMHLAARMFAPLLKKPDVRLVLVLEPQEYAWIEREFSSFTKLFEVIQLKQQKSVEYIAILQAMLPRLNEHHQIEVPGGLLQELVAHAERFPSLGQLPRSAITLLDECLAAAASKHVSILTDQIVQSVVASKTGIPAARLNQNEFSALKNLEIELSQRIVGQEQPIKKIAAALQRAALGMRNPHKPRGSFLMLGPSGVGKTETAKAVAEKMFGRSENFIRFDMSEFAQEHTTQRLIGAPAGYVGHEDGGALTNALKSQPHSLILLDEIEKAHPKVFDIFLQVLDDGRLTSGQNETVDARHAIIMMTSNIGVPKILESIATGADVHAEEFIQQLILPELTSVFRLEFLNRFDHILIFNPLSLSVLLQVAQLEIKKIEKRLAKHKVQFQIDSAILEERIKQLADPRFGARPVKRFIEETCESLLVKSLLSEQQQS
jgi:ATP-dependent Clp protease ATP-binding subunit ClpC